MKTADFAFELPASLIAQEPVTPRHASRLMVLNRADGTIVESVFSELPEFLRPDDLLVVNDSRVIPARLFGEKESGGKVELLLLRREGEGVWESLVKASKKVKPGSRISFGGGALFAEPLEERGGGAWLMRFHGADNPDLMLESLGVMPLPPYIKREVPRPEDREWYQTIYSQREKTGSVAAPTAGLHFTPKLLEELDFLGVERVSVTLHVGLGTFSPVRADELASHRMHSEEYEVSAEAAERINRALEAGRRVVAVGTTSARVLESAGAAGRVLPGAGKTDIFITPGYTFRVVGALVTNFHLPESTLLMLVSAFAGFEKTMIAYRRAVEGGYRFYSYGDAMFIY